MTRRPEKNQQARGRFNHPPKLSIIERIRQPGSAADFENTRRDSPEALRDSIRRNLDWLLNTRRVVEAPDESFSEVARSAYVFGIPDFAGTSLESPREQTRLRGDIAETIGLFEPRLTDIRIEKPERVGTGTLRFHIDALMLMDPEPEVVSFDVVLDSSSGEYRVKGDGNA